MIYFPPLRFANIQHESVTLTPIALKVNTCAKLKEGEGKGDGLSLFIVMLRRALGVFSIRLGLLFDSGNGGGNIVRDKLFTFFLRHNKNAN